MKWRRCRGRCCPGTFDINRRCTHLPKATQSHTRTTASCRGSRLRGLGVQRLCHCEFLHKAVGLQHCRKHVPNRDVRSQRKTRPQTARLGMALGTAGRSARSTLSNTLWLTFFWSPRYPRSSKAFFQDLLFRTSPMVVFKAFMSKVMSQRRRPLRIASFWQLVHNIFLNMANK